MGLHLGTSKTQLIVFDKCRELQRSSRLCWYWQLQWSGSIWGRLARLPRAAWNGEPGLFPAPLPREPLCAPWTAYTAKGLESHSLLSCLSLFLSVLVYRARGMMFWKDLKASQNESERNHWSSQRAAARGKRGH